MTFQNKQREVTAFLGGSVVGSLGGLIGLGGAEFRLPLLIGPFGFAALQAVIVNKAMSLVVVASALPFRAATVPFSELTSHWLIIVNLLAGSLLGAWLGAGWRNAEAAHRGRHQRAPRSLGVRLVPSGGGVVRRLAGVGLAGIQAESPDDDTIPM